MRPADEVGSESLQYFVMKRFLTLLLQTIVVLIGIGAFTFLLVEPLLEGRNAHATLTQVYFHDPFLAYVYASSILFFVSLYQAFRALSFVQRGETSLPAALRALAIIARCMVAFAILVVVPVAYLVIVRPGDDIAGGVFIGGLVILGSLAAAGGAAYFTRSLR